MIVKGYYRVQDGCQLPRSLISGVLGDSPDDFAIIPRGRRSDGRVDWLGEVEGSSTRTRGWAGAVSEHGVGGAQREPGHRDRTGPWTRTRPAAVMDTGRLQTVHKTGALLEVNSILAAII